MKKKNDKNSKSTVAFCIFIITLGVFWSIMSLTTVYGGTTKALIVLTATFIAAGLAIWESKRASKKAANDDNGAIDDEEEKR